MDIGGCRGKAKLYDKGFAGFGRLFELGTQAIFGNDEGCSALKELTLLVQIHAGIVSLTLCGLLASGAGNRLTGSRRTGRTCRIRTGLATVTRSEDFLSSRTAGSSVRVWFLTHRDNGSFVRTGCF